MRIIRTRPRYSNEIADTLREDEKLGDWLDAYVMARFCDLDAAEPALDFLSKLDKRFNELFKERVEVVEDREDGPPDHASGHDPQGAA